MKNVLKTAVAGAVAAAFVASVAVASGQQGSGDQKRGQDATQGRRGGPGGPGGPGAGRGGPMGAVMQDLTDEQRQQVKAILDAQRAGQKGPPPEAKLRQALEAELLADAPNDQKIAELKQQLNAVSSAQLENHIAVQRQINQILTAEQRAKARERIASRGAGRPRGGGPRGGEPRDGGPRDGGPRGGGPRGGGR